MKHLFTVVLSSSLALFLPAVLGSSGCAGSNSGTLTVPDAGVDAGFIDPDVGTRTFPMDSGEVFKDVREAGPDAAKKKPKGVVKTVPDASTLPPAVSRATCTSGDAVEVNPAEYGLDCSGPTAFLICNDGSYSEYDCSNPGSGFSIVIIAGVSISGDDDDDDGGFVDASFDAGDALELVDAGSDGDAGFDGGDAWDAGYDADDGF